MTGMLLTTPNPSGSPLLEWVAARARHRIDRRLGW